MESAYKIEINENFGRHLLSIRDLKAGDIVVDEKPFAIGPKQSSYVVCLECYSPFDVDSVSLCPKCNWPLCNDCVDKTEEHKGECDVFSTSNVIFNKDNNFDLSGICTQLDCITPLRVLLKIEEDPERWEKEVAVMESHDEARKKQEDIWNADLVNVAKYLRGPCKLSKFSEELIMKVIGILEVNAFEARTSQGYPIRCLYPISGILAHNCVPNTARTIYPSENYRICLRAMVDIKQGEQLHHSYTYTLQGTSARQAHLKSGKYFTCRCQRCSDPTELGTHFSSFKCNKCDPGLIIATDPFDDLKEWKCTNCDFKTASSAIQKAIQVMQSEIEEVQSIESGPERLENTEKLFRKFRSVLHPLHFIQISLRQNLIEMYGRVEGYEMPILPDVLLEHKEDLCRQVLRVLNVFEPGLSRSRALTLYELHVPIVLLAKTAYQAGILVGDGLKRKLQEAVDILRECGDILQYEDPNTPEGSLATVAVQAMEQLKISIEQI